MSSPESKLFTISSSVVALCMIMGFGFYQVYTLTTQHAKDLELNTRITQILTHMDTMERDLTADVLMVKSGREFNLDVKQDAAELMQDYKRLSYYSQELDPALLQAVRQAETNLKAYINGALTVVDNSSRMPVDLADISPAAGPANDMEEVSELAFHRQTLNFRETLATLTRANAVTSQMLHNKTRSSLHNLHRFAIWLVVGLFFAGIGYAFLEFFRSAQQKQWN